jgi:DNA-binding NarL/FixJ family response regulator
VSTITCPRCEYHVKVPEPLPAVVARPTLPPLPNLARYRLNQKELKTITMVAQAFKNREIAEELGTSEQMAKKIIGNIFRKTGKSTRAELIVLVVRGV